MIKRKFIILIIIFIIITICQYLYKNYQRNIFELQNKELNDKIKFNLKNKDKLHKKIYDELNYRINLLKSGKYKYEEWLKYNQDNILINYNNEKYYIFIYESFNEISNNNNSISNNFTTTDFLIKVHYDKSFINSDSNEQLHRQKYNLVFTKYDVNINYINKMFYQNITNNNGFLISTYPISDALKKNLVKKESLSMNYNYKNIYKGIIACGMEIENVIYNDLIIHYEYINKYIILFVYLTVFVSSLILLAISKNIITPILFLIILNIYIGVFLNLREVKGSEYIETDKVKNINDGILGVAFLIGVNIFILSIMHKLNKNKHIFLQTVFIFCIGIICLILSNYNVSNYSNIDELTKIRIVKQFFFNFSIILSIFIIINYFSFTLILNDKIFLKYL